MRRRGKQTGPTPEERQALTNVLADMRKMGAVSGSAVCRVCGFVVTDIPLNDVPTVAYAPCIKCGATWEERKRVQKRGHN